jgi:hypothetical protein
MSVFNGQVTHKACNHSRIWYCFWLTYPSQYLPITTAFTGVLLTYSEWNRVAEYWVTRKLNTYNIYRLYLFISFLNYSVE